MAEITIDANVVVAHLYAADTHHELSAGPLALLATVARRRAAGSIQVIRIERRKAAGSIQVIRIERREAAGSVRVVGVERRKAAGKLRVVGVERRKAAGKLRVVGVERRKAAGSSASFESNGGRQPGAPDRSS